MQNKKEPNNYVSYERMNKSFFYAIIVLLFILGSVFSSYARQTQESVLKKLYFDFEKIIRAKDYKNSNTAIDNVIEMIKINPRSYETIYAISFLEFAICMDANDHIVGYYKKLKEKYYFELKNVDSDVVEKIILSYMLYRGISDVEIEYAELLSQSRYGEECLNNIKDNCSSKDIAALTTMLLMMDNKYCIYFLEKFPNHPATPLVELTSLLDKYEKKNDYKGLAAEAKIYSEKYKNTITHFGWPVSIDYYSFIVTAYVELSDYSNAKYYLDLIEKEAPNYSDLSYLRSEVESIKKR